MSSQALLPADAARSIVLSAERQDSPSGIVSRTLVQAPGLRVVLFSFANGQELTPHTSTRRAIVQVLEGSCEFLFDGAWKTLDAGALLHMPPGHPHAVRAVHGSFSMLLTLVGES
jgi:quercetin dioxygenase-like cupin family protein